MMKKLGVLVCVALGACGKAATESCPDVSGEYNIKYDAINLDCKKGDKTGIIPLTGTVEKIRVAQKGSVLTIDNISTSKDESFKVSKKIDDTHFITLSGEYHGHKKTEGLFAGDPPIPANSELSVEGKFSGKTFSGVGNVIFTIKSTPQLDCLGKQPFSGEKIIPTI